MGLENLSHHLLPLIRYRRAKARKEKVCACVRVLVDL